MYPKWLSVFVLFSLAIPICIGQFPELAVSNIPDSLLKNASSVVRYHDEHIVMEEDLITKHESYAITVFRKKHQSKLSFHEWYNDKISKIKNVKIYILDAEGNVIKKVKNKEIKDHYGEDGISMISDDRVKYYEFEANNYPVTIRCEYTTISKNSFFGFPWVPIKYFNTSVQSDLMDVHLQG